MQNVQNVHLVSNYAILTIKFKSTSLLFDVTLTLLFYIFFFYFSLLEYINWEKVIKIKKAAVPSRIKHIQIAV